MRRRSLLAVVAAALALTVTAGLALTGCGSARMAALHANCTTKGLRWQLTVLKKKPHTEQREARLSIANTGAGPCVFQGFPLFEVHVGKGPESDAEGHGKALPIDLGRGGTVLAALRYRDCPGSTPPSAAMVSNDRAVVAAPRDYRGAQLVEARDEKGKRLRMTLCADRIWMDPPREAAE
ncbi:DUF4232 domain-containing protein [Streptomyces sp. NPDC048434]|uniref:DUF4232 domain-containing protein n=1 Tax=Streptomyces sp. NPDC048434 TaxID=3365549 RepID=UPI00371DA676